ncbi:DNA-directed DNA polymerase [Synchytrium microbalum]|uniref:DNA-directed DNA polymerase n=1 Tax=Synchytrium microbalum TaxID=1806994 RepID=A0A507BJP8_9FUNG|nr:DNA-directed DNA polymerase [Synchytrium microbalum]TPX30187.1 DNA-directed DNA polymerase [Synchytrium microbalum]
MPQGRQTDTSVVRYHYTAFVKDGPSYRRMERDFDLPRPSHKRREKTQVKATIAHILEAEGIRKIKGAKVEIPVSATRSRPRPDIGKHVDTEYLTFSRRFPHQDLHEYIVTTIDSITYRVHLPPKATRKAILDQVNASFQVTVSRASNTTHTHDNTLRIAFETEKLAKQAYQALQGEMVEETWKQALHRMYRDGHTQSVPLGDVEAFKTAVSNHLTDHRTPRYKIQVVVHYILRHLDTDEIRTWSQSVLMGETTKMMLIESDQDLAKALADVATFTQERLKSRPHTRWRYNGVYAFTMRFIDLCQPVGDNVIQIPKWMLDCKSIVTKASHDQRCFFDAMARCYTVKSNSIVYDPKTNDYFNKHRDQWEKRAKKLFNYLYPNDDMDTFPGILLHHLPALEAHFQCRIHVMDIQPTPHVLNGRYVYDTQYKVFSTASYTQEIFLHLLTQYDPAISDCRYHFSYICNMSVFQVTLRCPKCDSILKGQDHFAEHAKKCQGHRQIIRFLKDDAKHTDYNPWTHSLFHTLDRYGVQVPKKLRYAPFHMAWDLETYSQKRHMSGAGTVSYQQGLLSWSIASDTVEGTIQNIQKAHMNVADVPTDIPHDQVSSYLVQHMVKQLVEFRTPLVNVLFERYLPYLQELYSQWKKTSRQARGRYTMLIRRFYQWIEEIPLWGFNSAKFDVNVIRKDLLTELNKYPTNSKAHSKFELDWLQSQDESLRQRLQWGYTVQDPQEPDHRYLKEADFYDDITHTLYDMLGCEFHGCELCGKSQGMNHLKRDYEDLLEEQRDRRVYFETLGYHYMEVNECAFYQLHPQRAPHLNMIKTNSKYRVINTGQFSFKDIANFVTPGQSLADFLKAYSSKPNDQKFHLPHKYIATLTLEELRSNLKTTPITTIGRDGYYNDLKSQEMDASTFDQVHKHCAAQAMITLYELLVYYNNQDVKPLVTAIHRYANLFRTRFQVCLAKDGLSLASISNKIAFSHIPSNIQFHVFTKSHEKVWHQLKESMVGGLSCTYKHQATAPLGKQPRGPEHVIVSTTNEIVKVLGYDANSLYPWAFSQPLPTGKMHVYDYTSQYTLQDLPRLLADSNKFYFMEITAETKPECREMTSEFPVFIITTQVALSSQELERVQHQYLARHSVTEIPPTILKAWQDIRITKTINSYRVQHQLLVGPYIQFVLPYVNVTHIGTVLEFESQVAFDTFVDSMVELRRHSDQAQQRLQQGNPQEQDHHYTLLGDVAKLCLNTPYGFSIQNKQKYTTSQVLDTSTDQIKISKILQGNRFHLDDQGRYPILQLSGNDIEIKYQPRQVNADLPIQLGIAVYGLSKVRMLQFYYDVLYKYLNRSLWQLCYTDTDSYYLAIAKHTLDECVKPELQDQFQTHVRPKWFVPSKDHPDYLRLSRQPGLFKVEFEGNHFISLAPKVYSACQLDKQGHAVTTSQYKYSSKGVARRHFINSQRTIDDMQMALNTGAPVTRPHTTFQANREGLVRIDLPQKKAFQFDNSKRMYKNGIDTAPFE